MKCPVCNNVNLVMADRQGVEIDYCPQCRGVWLDRGELDKIIERSGLQAQPQQPQPQRQVEQVARQPYHDHHDHDYYKKKKHKSLLGDLFDF
ncbi:MAG: hypothetical protein A2511_00755 [Deltaproteobacteria bacterium RIFOXYD12_FULL_50_9]|nr:MAG: hypothetical protein A2511_00755 [Deltaproteobacteria bacterium RIFOXYD12_FULL_50_9]